MHAYPDRGLHGQVVRSVGSAIVRGDLAVGSTVDPDAVGHRFEVSRTVVREAFKVLGAKGLLEARPKRGTTVSPRERWRLMDPDVLRWRYDGDDGPSEEILDQLAEVRRIVEPAGAALAAERRTEADLGVLHDALRRLAEAGGDSESLTEADVLFHRSLLHAAHNELLSQMEIVIDAGLHARTRYVHRHDTGAAPSHAAHRKVLEAVVDRDPARASETMTALLDGAAEDVRRVRRSIRRPTGVN